MGIEINDLDSKGYETLIYKKRDNMWEETREKLFLLLYRFHIFKYRAGERLHVQDGIMFRNIYDHKNQRSVKISNR